MHNPAGIYCIEMIELSYDQIITWSNTGWCDQMIQYPMIQYPLVRSSDQAI